MSDDENHTGLSAIKSWRAIYIFVIITFALYVAVLVILPRLFS
jgi:hypothetical protein